MLTKHSAFRHFVFGGLLLSTLAQPACAALIEGDLAPEFVAPASLAGKTFTFSLREALKKGPVVVYFFPAAFTEGCNIEAHEFAVHNDQFVAAKATIVGVSLDNINRLNEFSADPDYCGGKIPVASDPDGKIAKTYKLTVRDAKANIKDTRGEDIDHGFAERTTFVVTADGRIAATIGGIAPAKNVEKALATIRQISSK